MRKETEENLTKETSIGIPKETLEALEKVAKRKDLPLKALLKFYVGQGLRNDLSQEETAELALKRLKSRKGSQISSEADLAA
jgi:predicted DNA-binding protein